jgi:hypothetical protein
VVAACISCRRMRDLEPGRDSAHRPGWHLGSSPRSARALGLKITRPQHAQLSIPLPKVRAAHPRGLFEGCQRALALALHLQSAHNV